MNTTKNAREGAEKVGEKASEAADKIKDTAKEAGHQVAGLAESVADKARDATRVVADKVGDAASYVGDKADGAAGYVGEGLGSLAGRVRDNAPKEGVLGSAADTVARGIEKTGDYLKDEGFTGMGKDLMGLVKNYPIPALLIGLGLGYLIARSTRS